MPTPSDNTAQMLADRVRQHLRTVAGSDAPITYQALAEAMSLTPPNTIHRITVALEQLIEEDALNQRPLIAALVVSKARGGLPAPGFFDCARRFGRLQGGDDTAAHASEVSMAAAYWRTD